MRQDSISPRSRRRLTGLTWPYVLALLGALALDSLRYTVSARLAPWLGVLSGLIIAGLGCMMLLRRLTGWTGVHAHDDSGLHRHWAVVRSDHESSAAGKGRVAAVLPVLMTAVGLLITGQAIFAAHLGLYLLTRERLGTGLFVAGLGLILGMRHSTDADHVVAISTIVSRQRSIRNAALIGSLWGLGHTITIFIVGSLIILFGVEIPPRVGLSMEFSVALMLILLGVLNLTGVMQKIAARFTPGLFASSSGAAASEASPKVNSSGFRASVEGLGTYQSIRPLVIGLVHGLAGSAAVALLVLTTIHNPAWATIYLLIFGAGTMLGMMCMTAAMAVPLSYAGDRYTNLSRYFGVASGLVSLCFGSFLVYQLGYLGGLFTSHPQWTPR